MYRLAGIFAAFIILLGAAHSPAAAQDKTLTVFAAASMKNALDDINAAYTAKTGIKVVGELCRKLGAGEADRAGRAGRRVRLRRLSTGWTTRAQEELINEPTRVNLLGNQLVLIAPKDSKIDNVTIGPGFDLAKLAGDGRIATGDVQVGAGRQIRQGGAGEARRLGGGRAEIRHGRERARRADAGGARRGGARHRLRDRRQGRAEREDRRHVPGRFASADHLSGRGDGDRQAGGAAAISLSCARRRRRRCSRSTASRSWCESDVRRR